MNMHAFTKGKRIKQTNFLVQLMSLFIMYCILCIVYYFDVK